MRTIPNGNIMPDILFPTWAQFRDKMAREVACENACTVAEALECSSAWEPEWRELVEKNLKDGWLPSQAWINTVQSEPDPGADPQPNPHNPSLPGLPRRRYGWWESFIKHHPTVHDALSYAGRSIYHPKGVFEAAWSKT